MLRMPGMYFMICKVQGKHCGYTGLKALLSTVCWEGMNSRFPEKGTWAKTVLRTVDLLERGGFGDDELRGLKIRGLEGTKGCQAICVGPVKGPLWKRIQDNDVWSKVLTRVDAAAPGFGGATVWAEVVIHNDGTRDVLECDVWSSGSVSSGDEEEEESGSGGNDKHDDEEEKHAGDGKKQPSIASYFKTK